MRVAPLLVYLSASVACGLLACNAERIVVLKAPVWKALSHHLAISRKSLVQDQPLFTPIRNNRTGVTT